jgi:WD40 repeat protein
MSKVGDHDGTLNHGPERRGPGPGPSYIRLLPSHRAVTRAQFQMHRKLIRVSLLKIFLRYRYPRTSVLVFFFFLKTKYKMLLLESATLSEQRTPLRSSSLPCNAYVLAIAALGPYYAASASAPSHRIFLFDKTSLRASQSFEGHQGGTTSLRAVDSVAGTNKRVIISSGNDGIVRVWDDRMGAAAIESTCDLCVLGNMQGRPCSSADIRVILQCHSKANKEPLFPVTYLQTA